MWLIDTTSLELKLQVENETPFAILSHRWQEGEPTFQDFRAMTKEEKESSEQPGVRKIVEAARQAGERDGHDHLWVDTCCINKDSSAELSEAINSMFRWYEMAVVCYAYLSDVDSNHPKLHADVPRRRPVGSNATKAAQTQSELQSSGPFKASRWFERVWTLQELLAPSNVQFFDGKWKHLGDKQSLSQQIADASNIDINVIIGARQLRDCSVAECMSWASKRKATKTEDVAYGLLGIFQVNLPLIYGEGTDAFRRLQKEILKKRPKDHSIFAWTGITNEIKKLRREDPEQYFRRKSPGLLASSPEGFRGSGQVRPNPDAPSIRIKEFGLQTTMQLYAKTLFTFAAELPCTPEVYIFLRHKPGSQEYYRVGIGEMEMEDFGLGEEANPVSETYGRIFLRDRSLQTVMVADSLDETEKVQYFGQPETAFRISSNLLSMVREGKAEGSATWDPSTGTFNLPGGVFNESGMVGSLDILKADKVIQYVRIGYDINMNPVVMVAQPRAAKRGDTIAKTAMTIAWKAATPIVLIGTFGYSSVLGMRFSPPLHLGDGIFNYSADAEKDLLSHQNFVPYDKNRKGLWIVSGERTSAWRSFIGTSLVRGQHRAISAYESQFDGVPLWEIDVRRAAGTRQYPIH